MTEATIKRRRVLAVLAGGLVLGVGTAITLAAWNDSEFATGIFGAGEFNLEGSVDGTGFSDHATSPGVDLDFTVAAENLSPTDVVYAPFAVRLDADTTYDATVELTSASTTGTITNLTYGLAIVDAVAACDATGFAGGEELVAAGTALNAGTGSFDLEAGASGAAGEAVVLCYEVTAGSIAQGQTATATWQFTATSE